MSFVQHFLTTTFETEKCSYNLQILGDRARLLCGKYKTQFKMKARKA